MNTGDRSECHFAVLNLFKHLRGDYVPPSKRFIIDEMFDTEKCQEFDLRRVREATAKELQTRAKTENLDEARKSEAACAEVIALHKRAFLRDVLGALPWSSQAFYFVLDNHVQLKWGTSMGVGIVSGCITRNSTVGVGGMIATFATWKIFS